MRIEHATMALSILCVINQGSLQKPQLGLSADGASFGQSLKSRMIWPIVCGTFAALLAFVLTLRIILGEDDETRALKSCLKVHGLEPRGFSNRCLTELIEIRTRHLRLVERPMEIELQQCIERVAKEVSCIRFGLPGFTKNDLQAQKDRGCSNPTWIILSRHDPLRYGLDHIEQTQKVGRNIV